MTVASSEPSGTGPGRADRPVDRPAGAPAPGQEGADLDTRNDADAGEDAANAVPEAAPDVPGAGTGDVVTGTGDTESAPAVDTTDAEPELPQTD